MASNGEKPVRDALISAVAAMIIAGVVMVLVAYKVYWALVFPIVGVLTFIIVLYYHPSRFYKRVVWACIGVILLFLAVPGFRAMGILDEKSAFVLMVDSIGTGGFVALCMLCIVAVIVCAVMEYIKSGGLIEKGWKGATAGPQPRMGLAKKEGPGTEEKTDEIKKPEKKKVESLWPGVSLPPLGGVKVSEPFAGREEELQELQKAMPTGKKRVKVRGGKTVVAVVGMAGQGKSCLVGEWYRRGARSPEGVGLIWRKVYEAGYTFDRFLDDFYLYLTGEEIDRKRFGSVEERAILVEAVFRERPCWIVLDGVERWLKRWAAEPDAGAEDLTIDDRAGKEAILDKFLKDAAWWENGSRLLLTTRAVPSGLDENPPIMIGKERERERRLEDLRSEEAVELLEKLGVEGDKEIMREAAEAYGNHPYAVHILGILIHDLYGGDVSRWEEVSPLKEKKIDDIFEKIIEHRAEDLELLELVACSVGPAPVEMIAAFLGEDEAVVRRRIAELVKWQMVEFEKDNVEQHAVVRRFMTERIGEEGKREIRKQIAQWWAEREIPVRPMKIEEVRPLLKAVEHLIEAKDPDAATDIFNTKWSEKSYYILSGWLRLFGYLDESIHINGALIGAYVNLIEKEGRSELRNVLARCYNNRGTTFWSQGKLSDAIVDYGKAIKIYGELVEKENRRELRNELAGCYNNRGTAYSGQGKFSDAIADYGKAIEIYGELVEKEGHRELRNYLAGCYNNRGNAYRIQGKLSDAIADYGKAMEIYGELVEKEGHRELRNYLAGCYDNRGLALRTQGRLSDAVADHGKAIEIYGELVEKESRRELRNDLAMCYNNRGNVNRAQGKLSDAIADYGKAIEIREELIEKEGRRELRNYLAGCYNNRGLAYRAQGKLSDVIADYGKAIEIREELVEKEGRRELRNDLAGCYDNRGLALRDQGKLSEAIADHGKAIEIYRELVEKENRRELRNDLVSSLNNRAVSYSQKKDWRKSRADIEKGAGLLRGLIEEGQRHVIESFLKTARFRCRFAKELGDVREAAEWANEGMRWFLEEVEAKRLNEVIVREAARFAKVVLANVKLLAKNGLDEEMVERFVKAIGGEGKGRI